MRYFFITLAILLGADAIAQTPKPAAKNTATHSSGPNAGGVYDSPQQKAYFSFGQDSLDRFIRINMHFKHVDNAGSGKAIVVFIVEKDGAIGNAEIISTSGDKDFDKEAVRVVKTLPAWVPAKDKGQAVRSSNMLTVAYQLR